MSLTTVMYIFFGAIWLLLVLPMSTTEDAKLERDRLHKEATGGEVGSRSSPVAKKSTKARVSTGPIKGQVYDPDEHGPIIEP